MGRWLLLEVLIAVLFLWPGVFDSPEGAASASACSANDLEVVRLFNVKRQEATALDGIVRPNLVTTEALCQAADIRCAELKSKLSHYRPNWIDFDPIRHPDYFNSVFYQLGIVYQRAAEFYYYGSSTSPAYIVKLWWNAPPDPTTGVLRKTEILRPRHNKASASFCSGGFNYSLALIGRF